MKNIINKIRNWVDAEEMNVVSMKYKAKDMFKKESGDVDIFIPITVAGVIAAIFIGATFCFAGCDCLTCGLCSKCIG